MNGTLMRYLLTALAAGILALGGNEGVRYARGDGAPPDNRQVRDNAAKIESHTGAIHELDKQIGQHVATDDARHSQVVEAQGRILERLDEIEEEAVDRSDAQQEQLDEIAENTDKILEAVGAAP